MSNVFIMAVGPACWGRGSTVGEAVRNAAKNWPSCTKPKKPKLEHFSLYYSESHILIDETGYVSSDSKIVKLQTSTFATHWE